MAMQRERRCYLGLGANLGDPAAQVLAAIDAIAQFPESRFIQRSPLYRSVAMGPGPQPDYCNAVCVIETTLTPEALLARTQALELASGRVRDPRLRWQARPLDIDLLLCGDLVQDLPGLHLPHPGIAQRNFVLAPLRDVAPDLSIPGEASVSELLARLGTSGLSLWKDQ
jgi:2-amino-4-hydroxy-6-hydroxymethyldihydropteridine diphosphokinase